MEPNEPEIMNVREMIDSAFGELNHNSVNFKLMQTVMYLMARQLNFLERRVYVAMDSLTPKRTSTLKVTEIKIQAGKSKTDVDNAESTSRKRISKLGKKKDRTTSKDSIDHTKSAAQSTSSLKFKPGDNKRRTRDKGSEIEKIDEMESKREKITVDSKSVKYTEDSKYVHDSATDSVSDSKGATVTGTKDESSLKSSSRRDDQVSTRDGDKTTTNEDKSDTQHRDEQISTRTGVKSLSSLDKNSTYTGDKNTPSKTMGPPRISLTRDLYKSTSIDDNSKSPTLTRDKDLSSADKNTKSIRDKTTLEEDISGAQNDDHSSTLAGDKQSRSADKRSKYIGTTRGSDKTTSREDLSAAQSGDKISTQAGERSSRHTDKSSTYTGDRESGYSDERKDRPITQQISSSKNLDPDFNIVQDKFETRREKVLRVIHQRADSAEFHSNTPTPIRSIDSKEAQFEKLLVVERVSSDEAMEKLGRVEKTPRLSIVTREQFDELAEAVTKIQERFGPIGMPGFPENAELMAQLRRGASLTDAMAALQLSARLEASEKIISYLTSTIESIVKTQGIKIDDETEVILGAQGARSKHHKRRQRDQESISKSVTSKTGVNQPDDEYKNVDYATYDDLDYNLTQLQTTLVKIMTDSSANTIAIANRANANVLNLEKKLSNALNLGNRMVELEALVSQYAEQITIMDTGLSAQMTNYQEQLTQMQHDLEIGVETMLDVLANSGTDTVAIAELNTNFTNLQSDVDDIINLQKEFKDHQRILGLDLANLWKDLEILREAKSDRDEVTDALRDKAGIADLNGMVAIAEFDAVRGDFEKRIAAAYDKFNNQETVWQKAIDDLVRELSEKASIIQVESLASEIERYLNIMKERMKFLSDIVGEPKAAAVTRKLFRDAACLSCASPAMMELSTQPDKRQPGEGAENETEPKGAGDGLCYPGYPISHPRDPRAEYCQRYCGGAHTVSTNVVGRTPSGLTATPIRKPLITEEGTDGRMYVVDEQPEGTPCLPCNVIPKQAHVKAGQIVTSSEVNRKSDESAVGDFKNLIVDIVRYNISSVTNGQHIVHDKVNGGEDVAKIEIIMEAPTDHNVESDAH